MQVLIENLTFNCIIGLLDFERVTPQEVIINVSFDYDFQNESEFIDYSKVVKDIESLMINEKFELLETAILTLENFLNKSYAINNLQIKISKPNILTNCIVSIKN